MNLLQIVQAACLELGIPSPSFVAGSTEPQITQLHALLNNLGREITRKNDWQRLTQEAIIVTKSFSRQATTTQGLRTVTMASTADLSANFALDGIGVTPFSEIISVDGPTQITLNMPAESSGTNQIRFSQVRYPLPSDWRKQINQTEWDRTNRWPLIGPKSPQEWQSFRSGIVNASPRQRFRIVGNSIAIDPAPPDGLTLAYEYISSAWVLSASGSPKTSADADTDTFRFDDHLLTMGLKNKWMQAKGLGDVYAMDYIRLLEACIAQDSSAKTINLSCSESTRFISTDNVPDGNWRV